MQKWGNAALGEAGAAKRGNRAEHVPLCFFLYGMAEQKEERRNIKKSEKKA
ncbi:MAG TPA: hypothetical protein H9733_03705 [Candidatus Anaerotignum merdipullorum]|nr:hypothetical protein [Candidatus Anaerotignum merdipullorum]